MAFRLGLQRPCTPPSSAAAAAPSLHDVTSSGGANQAIPGSNGSPGLPTVTLGPVQRRGLRSMPHAEALLDATSTLKVATGIVNVWTAPAGQLCM